MPSDTSHSRKGRSALKKPPHTYSLIFPSKRLGVMLTANTMAKVIYDPGISSVSGALSKPSKSGQHSCEKMLLATHRTAATTSSDCNRIYLRKPVTRTSPLTQREHQIRNRFIGVAAMIQERRHDLSKITTDQQTFIAQKTEPNGCKTMKQWYWRVCGQEWDQQHS